MAAGSPAREIPGDTARRSGYFERHGRPGAQELAASDAAGHVEVQVGYAAAIPFADASFDLVVRSISAHHWKNFAGALNEIHRVLRPGGRALI